MAQEPHKQKKSHRPHVYQVVVVAVAAFVCKLIYARRARPLPTRTTANMHNTLAARRSQTLDWILPRCSFIHFGSMVMEALFFKNKTRTNFPSSRNINPKIQKLSSSCVALEDLTRLIDQGFASGYLTTTRRCMQLSPTGHPTQQQQQSHPSTSCGPPQRLNSCWRRGQF